MPSHADSVNEADPIGVFDSGVGGLSVLAEIRRQLPGEELLYVADSGHVPYGEKTPDFIRARSQEIVRFLVAQGSKVIVVACNTATSAALTWLREQFGDLPFVGMEPAVKPAAAATRSGVIGVLTTSGTERSARFAALQGRVPEGIKVVTRAAPLLVERVEAGDVDGDKTKALISEYTSPLLEEGADTVVLGCTHFHYLRPAISETVGPEVTIVETAEAVARQVKRVLEERGLSAPSSEAGERFWTSGSVESVEPVVRALWDAPASVLALPASLPQQ